MRIPDERRIDVLLAQLEERYAALHNMRDRSMQFVLWVLGFGLALAWLAINEAVFTCSQKLAITVLLVGVGTAASVFVHAIGRGFKATRETVIRIEEALLLQEPGSYGIEKAILPPHYSNTKIRWTNHFVTLYFLTGTVIFLLLILTWANPCRPVSRDDPASVNQTQQHSSGVIEVH